jgi:hypothetical protein
MRLEYHPETLDSIRLLFLTSYSTDSKVLARDIPIILHKASVGGRVQPPLLCRFIATELPFQESNSSLSKLASILGTICSQVTGIQASNESRYALWEESVVFVGLESLVWRCIG